MRITYRTLAALIAKMDDDQKDSDVTVEIPLDGTECFAAELRIAGSEHDGGLDENYPVIYVHQDEKYHRRRNDVEQIAKDIGLS